MPFQIGDLVRGGASYGVVVWSGPFTDATQGPTSGYGDAVWAAWVRDEASALVAHRGLTATTRRAASHGGILSIYNEDEVSLVTASTATPTSVPPSRSIREGDLVLDSGTGQYCVVREVNSRNVWGYWDYSIDRAVRGRNHHRWLWDYRTKSRCTIIPAGTSQPTTPEPPKSFMSFVRQMDIKYNLSVVP